MAQQLIYPFYAPIKNLGPEIEVPGWNQRSSSPFLESPTGYAPDYYRGAWKPDFTQGRHMYRTQPRPLGPMVPLPPVSLWDPRARAYPTMVLSSPVQAHTMGRFGAADSAGGLATAIGYALLAVGVFLAIGG